MHDNNHTDARCPRKGGLKEECHWMYWEVVQSSGDFKDSSASCQRIVQFHLEHLAQGGPANETILAASSAHSSDLVAKAVSVLGWG